MGVDVSAAAAGAFVGRSRELEELRAALRTAAVGAGGVRLISGEPGIGKSRLAREVTSQAGSDGFAIGWGRTWEAGGAPPYWPWIRALRDLVRHYDEEQLREALRPAQAVTGLLPEVAELAGKPAGGSAGAGATADERFAVFEAVSTLLAELGARRPVLLVLEDIHAADESSLLLLQFVAPDLRAARVLALATFRDVEARQDEKRAARVSEIARQGAVLQLGGLSPEQSRSLLHTRLARTPDESFVAQVQDATAGNPFFIEELARLHRAGTEVGEVPVPLGVRETVRSRLQLLPASTQEVLVTAAVYGRSFDEQVVGRILERPAEEVVDLLRPAVDATLVVRDGGDLRFRHGLIREVLVDEAPAAHRARIHARVVHVLENLPSIARERHLSELAHHAVRAVSGNAEQAIVHAQNAGDAAIRALAFEEAVRQYEGALKVVAMTSAPDAVALDLLVALVKARVGAGDLAGAREAAARVRALATSTGSAQHLAEAALAYPSMAIAVWRVDHVHVTMLREALAALGGDGDQALRSTLLSTLVAESYFGRTPVNELAREAVQLAEQSGDPRALAQAQLAWQYTIRNSEQSAASLEQDQSVALARRAGDVALEARARIWVIGRWHELGALERVDSEIVAFAEMVERTRRPIDVWWQKVMRGMRLVHEGRYGEAEQAVRDAVDYGYRFAGDQALSIFGAQDYLVRLDRVPWEEVLAGLLALPDDFRQRLPVRTVLVHAHAALGQHERARDELAQFAAHDYDLLPRDRSRLTCLAQLASAAAEAGDEVRGAELLDLMAPYAGRLAAAGPFASFGPFDLHRGRLLDLLGRCDEAAEAFEAAVRLCDRTGGRPYAARSRLHYGRLLMRVGAQDRARELLTRARDEARELGLTLIETAATTALAGLSPAVPQQPAMTDVADIVQIRREGEYWSISSGAGAVRLRDTKGLHYLSRLIGSPGRDIHVLELAGGPAAPAGSRDDINVGSDDLGPVLDDRAKAEYRRRIEELQQEVDEATELHDHERAARAREEHDVFVSELSRALGLRGRDRRTGSVAEQARINVSKAVKTAIRRVHEQDPALGAELEASVRTGLFCTYLPLAGHRRWEVAAKS